MPIVRTLVSLSLVLALSACGGSGNDGEDAAEPSGPPASVSAVEYPTGIAFAEGLLWVADPEADTVVALDPATGETQVTADVGGGPFLVAAADEGVWVSRHLAGDVLLLDPATGEERERVPVGKFPEEVVSFGGSLWVTGGNARTIYSIPAGGAKARPVVELDEEIEGMTVTAEGVWLTLYGSEELLRFTLEGKARGSAEAGGGAAAVVAADGTVWVSNVEDGTLSLFDARSGRRTGEVDTGGSPRNLAYLHGRIWASDSEDGIVYEIDPAGGDVTTHEVPAPVIGFAGTPDAVWATAGDAGEVVRLEI